MSAVTAAGAVVNGVVQQVPAASTIPTTAPAGAGQAASAATEAVHVVADPGALVAALVLLGAGLLFVALSAVANQPRRPDAAVPSMDLLPDSPAVVDLVTNPSLTVTEEAALATVVDLAARGWVRAERGADGAGLLRTATSDGAGELSAADHHVLEHVRSLAVDGVLPLAALTTGAASASEAWWRTFRRRVVREATESGYVRRRWRPGASVPGWLALAGGIGLIWWAVGQVGGDEELAPSLLLALAAAAAIALAGVLSVVVSSEALRDTDLGRARAGEWLGVRDYLEAHGQFDDQPTAGVTLWSRYLSYAVALGLGRTVREEIPMGAEDDHRAWSTASGGWRQVRVRYPRFRPGWGRHPATAIVLGLLWGAVGYGCIDLGIWLTSTDFERSLNEISVTDLLVAVGSVAGLVLIGVGLLGMLWSAVQLVSGLVDVFARSTVTGQVVRARARPRRIPEQPRIVRSLSGRTDSERPERLWFYLAVDTGAFDRVDAWRVPRDVYGSVDQGQWVTARITGLLKRVMSISVVAAPVSATAGARGPVSAPDSAEDPEARRLAEAAAAMAKGSGTA